MEFSTKVDAPDTLEVVTSIISSILLEQINVVHNIKPYKSSNINLKSLITMKLHY